ncbi:MAG: PKD domain-containing protein [Spirochaetales bacterium]|nr:PKD domain-containing protein [Spirochaetales bacterium]
MKTYSLALCLALLPTIRSPLLAEITVSLKATQTAGPAPLGVVFDASATSSTRTEKPFFDILYLWDFGEDCGLWSTTSKPKRNDSGPIAAHVFETPGSYQVTLTCSDSADQPPASKTVTIVVTDPSQQWARDKTVCCTTGTDQTWGPSGCRYVTNATWADVLAQIRSDTRIMLKRGDRWISTSWFSIIAAGPGMICAGPGTDAKPKITISCTSSWEWCILASTCADWRFVDLEITAPGSGVDNGITVFRSISATPGVDGYLWLRCDVSYAGLTWYPGAPGPSHDGWVIQECTVKYTYYRNIYGSYGHLGVLGCTFSDCAATGYRHNMRFAHLSNSVIAHNRIWEVPNTNGGCHLLYIHNTDDWVQGGMGLPSAYIQVSQNHFWDDRDGGWSTYFGTQNSLNAEPVKHVLIDGNLFEKAVSQGGATQNSPGTMVSFCGDNDCMMRNNIARGGSQFFSTGVGYPTIIPNDVYSYNNSFCSEATDTVNFAYVCAGATEVYIRNNIAVNPNVVPGIAGSGTYVGSNNILQKGDPGWVSLPPRRWADFELQVGSPAVNGGVYVPVWRDFAGRARLWREGKCEVGALEVGGPGPPGNVKVLMK